MSIFSTICLGVAIGVAYLWLTEGKGIKEALRNRHNVLDKPKRKEKRKHSDSELPDHTLDNYRHDLNSARDRYESAIRYITSHDSEHNIDQLNFAWQQYEAELEAIYMRNIALFFPQRPRPKPHDTSIERRPLKTKHTRG